MEQEHAQIPSELFCVFKTTMSEPYKLPETPITVPAEFTESSLSELLNQLLSEQNGPEEPFSFVFEFLINNDFLRGTLKSHLLKHSIPSEINIVVNYCLALKKPKLLEKSPVEDWISAISPLNETEGPLLVGSFAGQLRLFGPKGKEILGNAEIKGKSLKVMKAALNPLISEPDYSHILYSGHADENVRISFLNFKENPNKKKATDLTLSTKVLGKAHTSSIEALDIHPLDNTWFATGSFDGEIAIMRFKQLDSLKDLEGVSVEGTKKKIKITPIKELKPFSQTKLHHDRISEILWEKPEIIITSSFDHNIKFFDVERSQEMGVFQGKDSVVTAISVLGNQTSKSIVSGHEDGYLKLWDARSKTVKKLLKSHSIWISKVRALPNSETLFASSGYDKCVKIWDIRSEFPLFSLKSHTDKVFCLEWNGDNVLASGGSDSEIHIHEF